MLTRADVERVEKLLRRTGLPLDVRSIPGATALELMRLDKKVLAGRIRLVLLRNIGEACVTADYPDDALGATLAAHFG